ncbi:helix-turn-helix domain-containing protein [Helcobacillus sp. ACRRO]|uniref:helix-turn-helix domain-containing protein n=1 Tax=Helcobacillus sp. ACRRO TaxID=2918202 RepID=UPI001EF53595|nr:helix-turn-helix domain-containing protein [Helcobacillus sp. ACRRO]MCG7426026.1 helix-turn-helix domain-containing protein [Helcobacillus sp. ACRRO]
MTADLMTVKETAEYLRRTESALRWLIYTEVAPPHAKLGGRIYFRRSDVDAWVDRQFAKETA